jgi:GNAT superfamily N-acetyltransferase
MLIVLKVLAGDSLPDDVTGKPYLGFSERDFRGTLADGDHLALVCNGPEVFALVRTQDRTQSRRVAGDSEFKSWEQLYDGLIERARSEMAVDPEARQRGSVLPNRALWQANREMCRRLGFAFYQGLWRQPLVLRYRP